jgi:2-polyprenyl-3-methyl-5-hydroxy-6-metoxy-1,4-benzoquinol methylase
VTECNICGAGRTQSCQTAMVRCNVRRFRDESFEVWRCDRCASIHASEPVDLDHYYQGYPIFGASLDWKVNAIYGNLLRRLRSAGLTTEHRILDHGCGNGLRVRFLQNQGYTHATGYDPYTEPFSDRTALQQQYDCVISQDVIEHADEPVALLAEFARLAKPGGIISVGTPDAAVLDLADPENYVHALHQPYHRHMLSSQALLEAGQKLGWNLERYYSTMYNNTLFPFINPRFFLHYVRCLDDVWDLAVEPIRFNSIKLYTPVTLFFALFGYFFDRHTDIMAVFKAP